MPFRHPQGAVLEWPENFHDILHVGPFFLFCEEWLLIVVLSILETLTGEFSYSVGTLKPLQCRIPPCLPIHNR